MLHVIFTSIHVIRLNEQINDEYGKIIIYKAASEQTSRASLQRQQTAHSCSRAVHMMLNFLMKCLNCNAHVLRISRALS